MSPPGDAVPPRELRESYDRSAARYDDRFAGLQRPKHEAVRARIPAGARVLDVGCGTGLFGGAVGVDLSFEMLRLARGRVPHLVQGTALALPFRDSSFDAVVAITSLLVAPRELLGAVLEMRRVLRAGGTLVVTLLADEVPAGFERDLRACGFPLEEPPLRCGQDLLFHALMR